MFVGFNYLLPVERELMEKLRDAGQALFFWDYVPDFQTNEKAFSFARLNSGILGNDGAPSPVTRNPSPVTLISCTSREAQAQYVHQWLQANVVGIHRLWGHMPVVAVNGFAYTMLNAP